MLKRAASAFDNPVSPLLSFFPQDWKYFSNILYADVFVNAERLPMLAHRLEAVLQEDGNLHLTSLPFGKGDEVEIIILKKESVKSQTKQKRTIGEYIGKIKLGDDFSEPLPDRVWLSDK
jgi:hypothetical protein